MVPILPLETLSLVSDLALMEMKKISTKGKSDWEKDHNKLAAKQKNVFDDKQLPSPGCGDRQVGRWMNQHMAVGGPLVSNTYIAET